MSAIAATAPPYLAAIDANADNKRNVTYTKSTINGKKVNTMVDSGSSNTYISKKSANRLGLFILPKSERIPMADPNHKAQIIGEVVVDIAINGRLYIGLVVGVMKSM